MDHAEKVSTRQAIDHAVLTAEAAVARRSLSRAIPAWRTALAPRFTEAEAILSSRRPE